MCTSCSQIEAPNNKLAVMSFRVYGVQVSGVQGVQQGLQYKQLESSKTKTIGGDAQAVRRATKTTTVALINSFLVLLYASRSFSRRYQVFF